MIHISDLSWHDASYIQRSKLPSEFCNIGDELEVVILEVDKEKRRISLGHKQIFDNPWDTIEEGTTHRGKIIDKKDRTGIVKLPCGLEAICPARHMRKKDGSTLKTDEESEFLILEIKKEKSTVIVSHTITFDHRFSFK